MDAISREIEDLRSSVSNADQDERPILQNRLVQALLDRSRMSSNGAEDLASAIKEATEAFNSASIRRDSQYHNVLPDIALNLTDMLILQFNHTKDKSDLDRAIGTALQTERILPEGHQDIPSLYKNIAGALCNHSIMNHDRESLDYAISYLQRALLVSDVRHPEYYDFLIDLSSMLFSRFEDSQNIDDSEEAIMRALQAETMISENDSRLRGLLDHLAVLYCRQYRVTKDRDDLEAAMKSQARRESMKADEPAAEFSTHQGDKSFEWRLPMERFKTTMDMKEIDTAISRLRARTESETSNQSQHCSNLANLSAILLDRAATFGAVEDVDEAIVAAKSALSMMSENHRDRPRTIENLCGALCTRGTSLGRGYETVDIEFAVQALHSKNEDAKWAAGFRKCQGMLLRAKFSLTGDMSNIESSISVLQTSVDLAKESRGKVGEALSLLSGSLRELFVHTGDEKVLDRAILNAQEALDNRYVYNTTQYCFEALTLANLLELRYRRTGNTTELNEAIDFVQMAKERLPVDHQIQPQISHSLAVLLILRFHRRKDPGDIDDAISEHEKAIAALPADDERVAGGYGNLARCYMSRYNITREISCINSAVDLQKKALEASREEVSHLLHYAYLLQFRYVRLNDPKDLEESLASVKKILQSLPDDHPSLGNARSTLADGLQLKFMAEGDQKYMEEVIENKVFAANHEAGQVQNRIRDAQHAIYLLCRGKNVAQANELAGSTIGLLPRLCSRQLSREDQQHAVQEASGLAADGCSLALLVGDVDEALRRIEFGRGLILGYLIDGRNDLTELRERDPYLAMKYEELRSKVLVQEPGNEEVARHLERWEEKIRQEVPGFENFLRPPPVDEMMKAAADGPIIVVNITEISADAIIVRKAGRPERLPLPAMMQKVSKPYQPFQTTGCGTLRNPRELRDAEPEDTTHSLVESLSELWEDCVLPILIHLGLKPLQHQQSSSEGGIPRTWWIGTGQASGLSFHAAGNRGSNALASCLNWTVPSYTPSIKALEYARKRAVRGRELGANHDRSVLIATMPSTPGQSTLPGVRKESKAIETAVRGAYKVTARELPTAQQVLDDMQHAGIVHFACHGSSDPTNPLRSHLLLQRTAEPGVEVDKLTMESLISAKAQTRAWVAYLAACSTAQTKAHKLRDENLHITSAFAVAGFAHVIGSMGPVDDWVSVEVARLFYEYLSKYRDTTVPDRVIAEALRHATLEIREKYPNDPSVWAPYLHYGA